MVYVDPYLYDPRRSRQELALMTAVSLVAHFAVVGSFWLLGERLFGEPPPPPPQKVYEISLVAAVPQERPRSLPDKVTSAPAAPAAPEVVKIPDPVKEAEPPKPVVEEPKPPKPEPPKPEPKKPDDLGATLERLASLKTKLKSQQGNETPVPQAPVATRNRPNASDDASAGSRSNVREFKPDTPEGRYLGRIRTAIINAWIPNKRLAREEPNLLVIVRVEITPDGRLSLPSALSAAIEKSSGNESFDQSALRAARIVAQQERFPEPPGELAGITVGLRFSPGDAP